VTPAAPEGVGDAQKFLPGASMLRRSLQIVLLSLACVIAALVLAAHATDLAQLVEPAAQDNVAPSPTPTLQSPPLVGTTPAPAASEDGVEPPLPKVSAPKLDELLQPIGEISAAIESTEAKLEQPPGGQKELAALRAEIEKIQFKAKEAAEALAPRLEEVRSQIGKLGEAPAEGAPPEAPEVAAERDRLNGLAAQIDGAIKKAALVEVRAQQLISRVQHVRQGIFTRFLLQQTHSPLQSGTWRMSAEQISAAREKIVFIATNWWSIASQHTRGLLGVLAAAFLAYVVLLGLMGRLVGSRLGATAAATPPLSERAAKAVWVAVAFALPAALAAIVLYVGLDELELLYWQTERFAQAILFAFLVFVVISALARAVLQPNRPQWRIFDLGDASAASICLTVQTIAAVYALEFLARRTASILALPASVGIASAFVASVLVALLLFGLARTPFVPRKRAPGAPVSRWRPFWLKALIVVLAAAVLGTSMLGYAALSRFIAGQVLMTGSGLLLVALLHLAIGGLRLAPAEAGEGLAHRAESVDTVGRQRFLRALRILLNALLLAVATPLVLLAWGISGPEILSWLRAGIFGFEVGGTHISLVRILLASILFVALLGATRLFQRWLTSRALPETRWDPGLVNSVYTGAGYIGFAVALLAAVAYAGFDITSLAIVAGALSVGIGFGLQGIVNNFVSGLVLLVERPIKVGDWVSTSVGEGYVRRIAVRATEIETFDRASLIVPNSELVTHAVTNLTHRNELGRLNINVRVSYAADPALAQRVLQEVADANTSILRHPPPMVVLDNLGDQALEYSVRVYLADINRKLQVQTEVRTEIVNALRASGIDIPYFAVQVGHANGPRLAPDRVTVKIGAALKSDPEAVQSALLAAAQACQGARTEPAPEITFDNVSDGALEFSVSVAVADGADAKRVETALRTAIVKTLHKRGIDLAGQQHAAPPRELDGLRGLVRRSGEEPARAQHEGAAAGETSTSK